MAGKVKEYVTEHRLAVHTFGSDFNGFGYATKNHWYLLCAKDAKVVQEMIAKTVTTGRKTPSPEEKKTAWCRRLVKLTGVDIEIAKSIADEKLEAQEREIEELEERQWSRCYSVKREKLINKIRRSNPLRRIKDRAHAFAILQASIRHTASNYESMLEEARDKAAWGEIDYSEVKSYARCNTTYWGDVQTSFFEDDDEENASSNVE